MRDNSRRFYFKQDVLNFLYNKYWPYSIYDDGRKLFAIYDICVYNLKKVNKTDTVEAKELDKFYYNAMEAYDTGTWLKLAVERLSSLGIRFEDILRDLQYTEEQKHGEKIEISL